MNYYDDYSDCVFGVCDSCKEVHRINRRNLVENATGYKIISPLKCSCGVIHEEIEGHSRTPEIEKKYKKESWKIFYRR